MWPRIKDEIIYQLNQHRAFIALAGTEDNGRITIRRVTELAAGYEQYARLAGFTLAAGDEIVCLMVGGKPVVLGKLQRATQTDLKITNTSATAFTVEALTTVDTFVVDTLNKEVELHSGADLRGFSDAGVTEKWNIDGATGDIQTDGALDHDGTTVGLYGVAPAVRPAAYTVTNLTTDRAYDANTVAVAELADVVGTLLADLKTLGIVQ